MDKLYEELFRVDESVPQAEICGDVSDDQQDRFFRNVYDYG